MSALARDVALAWVRPWRAAATARTLLRDLNLVIRVCADEIEAHEELRESLGMPPRYARQRHLQAVK